MAIQRIQGAFRNQAAYISLGSSAPVNVFDPIFEPPTNPAWTRGAMLIDALQLTQPASQQWTLQQISIAAQLVFRFFSTANGSYGKLGKILAGMATMISPTNGGQGINNLTCVAGPQIPPDRTAIGTLWDPSVDELPPLFDPNASLSTLPVSLTIDLPTPMPIDQAEQLGVGIWMLPNLFGWASGDTPLMYVCGATWAVVYDDGTTPPSSTLAG